MTYNFRSFEETPEQVKALLALQYYVDGGSG
jgi:hypothetical protein